jgi:hypothetical protein
MDRRLHAEVPGRDRPLHKGIHPQFHFERIQSRKKKTWLLGCIARSTDQDSFNFLEKVREKKIL